MNRFASYSAPRSDAVRVAAQDDSGGPLRGLGAALAGNDNGMGMGRWLPFVLLASLAAAVFVAVDRARR